MRKSLSILLLIMILSLLSLAGCGDRVTGGSGEDGKIKIIAAHNQTSPENPYQYGMKEFKRVAEEKSNGNIEVEVHAGTLGTSESELVQKLKLGGADVVLVSPGFMSKTGIKEIDLFAMPYVFESYDHWEKVVDGKVGDKVAKMINKKSDNDFKLLGYWSAGVRHYYGKKPLHSIEDIEGMKLRTQTSGAIADYWEATGAVPTAVAWGELYQALQQGVVDASENSYPYFVQQNHHKTENGKYITETAHDYTTRFLLINGNKFDSYTEEQQDVIMEAAQAAVEKERKVVKKQEEEYKQKAIEDGAEVNQIDRQPFIELAKPIQNQRAKEINTMDLLKQIRELK
ncbi:TRAP transporter substrate-binding protein [Halobacillus shinanisalinarum]|uniref:TRAP transporter substrate-binding protein n=1 Tax=Halobacillus shinanisalinarum TaxID=2932258 RepID=A0ABY4H4Z4_9BACI|nr:TRAP transporter substrate-binding protein [Halobacillus shinanisalinarum]UOQ95286.1 TRAP transporter substrate-binding protein [Halobacillus shinanisalinarum]